MFFLAPLNVRIATTCHSWPLDEPEDQVGFANENALRALTLPRNHHGRTLRLESPDKLQKRCRFVVELGVEPADPREAALGERQLAFRDSTLHCGRRNQHDVYQLVVSSAAR